METQKAQNGNGVEKSTEKKDFISISDREAALLNEAKTAVEEEERALGEARARFLRQERDLIAQIDARRKQVVTLLDMIGRMYLRDREGSWDYSPKRGGFVLVTEEEESK